MSVQFLGALLLGRGVTDTVRKGIAEREFFEDQPEILMYGMFCALIAAGTWLLVATYFELPVSTTHSIIGYAVVHVRPVGLPPDRLHSFESVAGFGFLDEGMHSRCFVISWWCS